VKAIEAVIIAVTVFIVLFALLYAGLANADSANFNQQLDRLGALYFTATILCTVGFGDIVPQTSLARLIVTVQMLLDLALVAIIVRVFFSAARASGRG
jgi:voltage-gated potassium channel